MNRRCVSTDKTAAATGSGTSGTRTRRLMNGAVILAVGSIIAKLLGAFYRVPLTNILGTEGMGMYQLVFPVYALFMTMSTAGIPTALSRIVAEKKAQGEGAKKYLASALITLLALSALAGLLVTALSSVLARWQGNEATAYGYIVIAPSIFFVGIIAGFRGWFQGEMYMVPTAVSNIVEQSVKLAVGIGLAVAFSDRGMQAAVFGALAGITVSEIVAALYLAVTYIVRSRKESSAKERLRLNRREAVGMFKVAFPIAVLGLMMPLSSFCDSLIVVNALKWGGAATSAATAWYGLYSGPVASLVNMPVVIIMSLAIAAVPSVSLSRAERDLSAVLVKSRMSVKLVYTVGVPAALFFMVFGRSILSLLYPALSDGDILLGYRLLMVSSFGIVLSGATQIYISLLQGLDKTVSAIKSLFAAIIVKIVLSLVLVRFVGIMGAAAASVAMGVVSLALCNVSFSRYTGVRLEKNIAQIMLAGVIMALTGLVVREYVPTDMAKIAVGAAVSVLLYLWLTTLFGVFSEDEFYALPLGKYLVRFRRKIRFWEQNL